jgi:16S rRNA (guanine527-N7)-methyltransferase
VKASGRDLAVRHILDSLAALPILAPLPRARAADIGSGAGLPGIPLAIALPDSHFSLIEPSGRRCRFLENQRVLLGLSNVEIMQQRLEELDGVWDLLVFRAVWPLEPGILGRLTRVLAPGGTIAAYKGRRSRLDPELEAAETAGLEWELIQLAPPFLDEERHLVLLRRPGRAAAP